VPDLLTTDSQGALVCGAVESDVELLRGLREGNEQAFVTLVERYQGRLLRLARSMVPNAAVAEEVVQDTWMAVVTGVERFEGRSSLKTWLFRILANRARSAGARELRSGLPSGAAVDPSCFDTHGAWAQPVEPWSDRSDDRLDAERWAPLMRAALEHLPERQRQVVILRDVEGLSTDEVCDVLDVTRGNQRILLHRGRTRLREALQMHVGGR
jgi:RNA polymerase sigma-70 factor, ECF subfamily